MWAGKGFCFAPIAAHIITLIFIYFNNHISLLISSYPSY